MPKSTYLGLEAPNRTFVCTVLFEVLLRSGILVFCRTKLSEWTLKRTPKVRFWHTTVKCCFCTGPFLINFEVGFWETSDPDPLKNHTQTVQKWFKSGASLRSKSGPKSDAKVRFFVPFSQWFWKHPKLNTF